MMINKIVNLSEDDLLRVEQIDKENAAKMKKEGI